MQLSDTSESESILTGTSDSEDRLCTVRNTDDDGKWFNVIKATCGSTIIAST